jgi:hypothetical protein
VESLDISPLAAVSHGIAMQLPARLDKPMFPLLACVNNSSVIGDALSPTSGEETRCVKKKKK